MGQLLNIFEPAATPMAADTIDWDGLTVAAFDVMGTLVKRGKEPVGDSDPPFVPNGPIIRVYNSLVRHPERFGLKDVVVISSDVAEARRALTQCDLPEGLAVTNKMTFYDRATASGDKVLAFDDEAASALLAEAVVNPNSEQFKALIKTPEFRRALLPP